MATDKINKTIAIRTAIFTGIVVDFLLDIL